MLAPLRSDIRELQAQVTELTETLAELRPRRKATAAPALSPAKRAVAERTKKAAAPAKKALAAKKAPAKKTAGRRRTQ